MVPVMRSSTDLLKGCALLLLGSVLAFGRPSAAAEAPPRLFVQAGHSARITSAAFSPDGRRVLTGSADKVAALWDVETGKQLQTFAGHTVTIAGVAFSPDGTQVLTASWDTTAKLWSAETGKQLRSFVGHSRKLIGVAFSPDGRRVLTGSVDGTARLWDAATGRQIRSFTVRSGDLARTAFSPDGRWIAVAGNDITLWDARTGKKGRSLGGEYSGLSAFAFSADGRRLVARAENALTISDVDTGRQLYALPDVPDEINDVGFSPDGRTILASTSKHIASAWDAESRTLLRSLRGGTDDIDVATFSPDRRRVLTASTGRTAVVWDAETGRALTVLTGHSDGIRGVTFSPDGRRMLTGGNDGTARLWDVETGRQVRSFAGHSGAVTGVAFCLDGRRVVTGSYDATARLWDAETGRLLRSFTDSSKRRSRFAEGREFAIEPDGMRAIASISLSPDGRRLVAGRVDSRAIVWNIDTGEQLGTVTDEWGEVTGVSFSSDGRRLLIANIGPAVGLWDADSQKPIRSFAGSQSATFSPDGRRVLTGSNEGVATLWDAGTGRELRRFVGHRPCQRTRMKACWPVVSVAFAADGRRALTGSWDATAILWDTATGRRLRSLIGHEVGITSVALSPDGRRALTGGMDGLSKVWDTETGRCLATLVSFSDGSWAVVDASGRFDGSHDGDVEGLHWVVGDTTLALSQLKERYYEPGLLAKVMGFDKAPLRPVELLANPQLFPTVVLTPPAPGGSVLAVDLENRGGGIGQVRVLVNGREIVADARGGKVDPTAARTTLSVDLAGPALKPGQNNHVEVIAWNAEGYLSSRGATLTWHAPGARDEQPPEVYAIVSGVAHYGGPALNLTFAGKDAADMAAALQISAERLFGATKVHIKLLTDYPGATRAVAPTRENLRKAFADLRRARRGDVLIVYLAGHGATAPDGEYWYLTRDARSTDLSDPQVRALSGVSSAELTEWLKAAPMIKQVMILDTCAAGAAAAHLAETRALSADQVRAIARLKDRTGLHVLMGAAADAVSYEASQYGQGLLTYALLQGMRGAALRDDDYVDVAKLFGYATEEVPRLARSIGGIQSPIISAPRGASFDIGQVTPTDRPRIPLALVRPMILRAAFQREQPPFSDGLDLTRRVNGWLRQAADPGTRGGAIVFIDGDDLPGALRLSGRYRVEDTTVRVDCYLLEGDSVRAHFEEHGQTSDLDALARAVAQRAAALTASPAAARSAPR
jgi:WD40 repeat protein